MKLRTAITIVGLATQVVVHPIARAAPMQLEATALDSSVGSFVVDFDDTVGDGLLRLAEVTSFSGVEFPCTPGCGVFETTLLLLPSVAGIAAGTGSSWGFGTAQSGGNLQAAADASLWRYTVQPAAAALPEPGTAALAALALATLGIAARRRRGDAAAT